ncbi:hypothetical protein L210DRAFT_3538115 [Boletus edulis BED1]|uniref:Uncharacterized protein n=1 Tax=Boletus edulis BED1 TaxID=1328754 RepID=A0AAD4GG44_BOLED|nr:hypothetical protein L210DRAFT_3538115 [Boletus edulis BED1]
MSSSPSTCDHPTVMHLLRVGKNILPAHSFAAALIGQFEFPTNTRYQGRFFKLGGGPLVASPDLLLVACVFDLMVT